MTDNHTINMKLELVPLPVSDVDRAKKFYTDKVGFHMDLDVKPSAGMRIVQLTPPGSACSIMIGTGMGDITDMKPGSFRGLHLVVKDIASARQALLDRGLDISDIQDMGGVLYAYFSDPDGNTWAVQEIRPDAKMPKEA
ncbi:MAG TPA: VOC family protein [Candidatus Saccharimonadales bacterium]|nr:VOC family protein [Candidatus Saccharimonadales bacterium]